MNLQALSLGLYVHIPLCANACDYCHFFKITPSKEQLELYFRKLKLESFYWKKHLKDRRLKTIFWGGGSPSCLSCEDLIRLNNLFMPLPNIKEWTVEVSPINITPEKLDTLKAMGVSRISMGVQSFNETILKKLGRRQTSQQVYKAYDNIRNAGFQNVNLDLIFLPDFSDIKQWESDLVTAIRLQPEHISTYCLTYENESGPFSRKNYKNVDECREADFYEFTWKFLNHQGYQHYEISNFSKPGFECLHNLNTWRMQDWIGLGPSAASQLGLQRFQNAFNLNDWVPDQLTDVINLTQFELFQDCLIFGLRTTQGIDQDSLYKRFPNIDQTSYNTLWEYFEESGWIYRDNHHIRCTTKGLLIADSLALEILNCENAK